MISLIPKLEKNCKKCIHGDDFCPVYAAICEHERATKKTDDFYNDVAYTILHELIHHGECKMFKMCKKEFMITNPMPEILNKITPYKTLND